MILQQLQMYMNFPFVQYALIAGVMIALSSSLLGVPIVLRRLSFIGDSLSHVAFLASIIAGLLQIHYDMAVVMPVTILCTLVMMHMKSGSAGSDARLAVASVSSLALGYLLINRFSNSANVSSDVCTSLFGSTSILTLKSHDVWLCVGMSIAVLLCFLLFYHYIFAFTFDRDFCQATGIPARLCNDILSVVTAIIIVLSMKLVGSLLTTALIIFPTLSAMRFVRSFRGVVITSAVMSVLTALLGILISILWSTPVGSTIVAIECVVYLFSYGIGLLRRN